MNAATQRTNLKVELFWAIQAMMAESRRTEATMSPGYRSPLWWGVEAKCTRLESRIAFLEDMHGAHTMAPEYPTAPTGIELTVWQARCAWVEHLVNRMVKNAMWSLAWDTETIIYSWDLSKVDGDPEIVRQHIWASEVADEAHTAMRSAQMMHDTLCRSLLMGEGNDDEG